MPDSLATCDLLVFLITIVSALEVHDTLLGNMCGNRGASLNLTCLAFRSGHPLLVLRVTLVDRRGIDIFIIVGLETEEALIRSKLIPGTRSVGLLQAIIKPIGRIGHPAVQSPLISEARVGDGSVSTEGRAVAYGIAMLERTSKRDNTQPVCPYRW